MKFNAGEIASVIQKEIEDFRGQLQTSEVGRVVEVGDGIARVYGWASAMAGEMVEFSSGVRGQVFNLEENSVGVIILGDYLKIAEGDEVKTTGKLLSETRSSVESSIPWATRSMVKARSSRVTCVRSKIQPPACQAVSR